MKSQMQIYYDEEGDFLEISIGEPVRCYADEIAPGVFIRKDEETDEVKSIGILEFKKRTKEELKIALPFKLEIVS